MSKWVIGFIIVILLVLGVGYFFFHKTSAIPQKTVTLPSPSGDLIPTTKDQPALSIVAQDLDTPWALAFLPDGSLLFTQRPGTLSMIAADGTQRQVAQMSEVAEIGEGGLLGLAIDPEFSKNNFIYMYYTYQQSGENTRNRVVRYTFKDQQLSDPKILIDAIPGAPNHDGGRMKFGPDGFLYITTGDSQEPSLAQDKNSVAGKILRVTTDGKAASGNPFGNLVYSYGHRNPQGLAWDATGNLWATEHGRSIPISGLDELNLIKAGTNYGWPIIQGDETRSGMQTPVRNSGSTTWAPAGIVYLNGSLFFGGLKGQSLYEAVLDGQNISDLKVHFKGKFGRVRDVILGPDGMLYITTSNKDGRGSPLANDDKILRVNPAKL